MKYSLMLVISLLSSVVFAGKPNEGAEYVGRDSVKNGYCIVEIKKIEKSFMVDKITAQIAIQGLPPREVTFGEYDITENTYERFYYDSDARMYSKYAGKELNFLVGERLSLKVSKDKSEAELNWYVMDVGIQMPKCKMRLKQPEPKAAAEISNEASETELSHSQGDSEAEMSYDDLSNE